jgi:hypothetical protein
VLDDSNPPFYEWLVDGKLNVSYNCLDEEPVSKPSVGVLLARSAENVAAIARIGSDFADLVPRNLRLAGRADVTRLARQLDRTEEKLERLLREVEELRDELARGPSAAAGAGTDARPRRTREAS